MKNKTHGWFLVLRSWILTLLFSCGSPDKSPEKSEETKISQPKIPTPNFNADSAYQHVKTQVDLGPRVPGSKAHEQCADFIIQKLRSYRWEVVEQKASARTYDGKSFNLKNIIGSFNIQNGKRIMLCAHWDTRPFADRDSVGQDKPIDGADDGGSGVGVLLEVARQVSISKPDVGLDLIFFDLEDYGQPQNSKFPENENSWCLGSQYWGEHPHKPGYYAQFGILLDMVGGKNAVFPMEGTSMYYAPSIVEKVWKAASGIGYSNYFVSDRTNQTTDDHLYINALASIPCIDIVHYDPAAKDYGTFHHRHSDNIGNIDPQTLKVVGQTLLEVVYSN